MLSRFSTNQLFKRLRRPISFNARGLTIPSLRDANAPKKPPSAYNIFMSEKSTAMRQQSVGKLSSTDVFRRVAAEWKVLSEGEKQSYRDQVVGTEEYADRIAQYRKSEAYIDFKKRKDEVAKKKKLKEFVLSNAPKRPRSAYIYFSNEIRERVQVENPDAPVTQVMKLVGAAWRELPEVEKYVYEGRSRDDKIRYEKELEEHHMSAEYQEMQSRKIEYLNILKKNSGAARERRNVMAEKEKVKKLKEREKKKLDALKVRELNSKLVLKKKLAVLKSKEMKAKLMEKKKKEKEAK